MQSSTYNLPPIRALLGSSPINEVSPYGGNYPQSLSPTYSSVSTDAYHLSAINSHNKFSSPQHAGNIRSLTPPESPDLKSNYQSQSHYNCYGAQPRYDVDRYASVTPVTPQQTQQTQQTYEDCSCCVKPTPIYSTPAPAYPQYVQQSQSQRYGYIPNAMTSPVSPYDNKQIAPSLPRLNTILEGLAPTKHFAHKSLAGPISPTASGGNRYQCPYCSKRFSRPSSLRIHTYSHTGEKPFVCTEPGCGRKFSVQSNMRRHLRVHRLGRPVKKTRYDGEVEGYKMLSPAGILRSY